MGALRDDRRWRLGGIVGAAVLGGVLVAGPAAAQTDPWTGEVAPLRADVTTAKNTLGTLDSRTATMNNRLTQIYQSEELMRLDMASMKLRQEQILWWLEFLTFWYIAAGVGFVMWQDFHLGGKFHLGERRAD